MKREIAKEKTTRTRRKVGAKTLQKTVRSKKNVTCQSVLSAEPFGKNFSILLVIAIASIAGLILLTKCEETEIAIDNISAYITNILSKKQVRASNKIQPCIEKAYSGEIEVRGWYEDTENGPVLRILESDLQKLPKYEDSENFKNKNSRLRLVDATEKLEIKLNKATEKKPVEITLKGYGASCEGNPLVSIETGEMIFRKIQTSAL